MAAKYQDHKEYFGLAMTRKDRQDFTNEERNSLKENKKLITKGYQRIL